MNKYRLDNDHVEEQYKQRHQSSVLIG